jgi:hypothetical protein
MPFYGLLLLGCIISTIILAYSLRSENNINNTINIAITKYSSYVEVQSFVSSLENTHVNYIYNSIYNNWINQLNISAYVDGLNIKKEGRLYIISSYQDPTLYKEIYIN